MPQAAVQAAAQGVIGMIDERLPLCQIPMLAEFARDPQPVALLRVERLKELTKTLFGDAVGGRGVKVSDAGVEGEFQQFDCLALGRNLARNMTPRPSQADNP